MSSRPIPLLLIALAAVCAACNNLVPVRPSSVAVQQRARQFRPPPGKASVYVLRRNAFAGSAAAVEVELGPKRFGSVPERAWLYGEVDPAPYTVTFSFNGPGAIKPLSFPFKAEADRCHFIAVSVGFGGFQVAEVPEAEGRQLAAEFALSGDNRFERQFNAQE